MGMLNTQTLCFLYVQDEINLCSKSYSFLYVYTKGVNSNNEYSNGPLV